MGTDNPYWCPTRYGAASFANSTGFPVWLYNFDHVASYKPWPPEEDFCNLHVCKLFNYLYKHHRIEIRAQTNTQIFEEYLNIEYKI